MKKIGLQISKLKNEKGSVIVFVVCAMIFFLSVAISTYSYNANKLNAQKRQIAEIRSQYEVSDADQKEKYEEIVTSPTNTDTYITKTTITLDGNGATSSRNYYNLQQTR